MFRNCGDEILKELRALRRDLAPLLEFYALIASEAKSGSSLPADFPGKATLEQAGITAVSQIPRTIKSIERLPGMTEGTAMAIARRLANG